MIRTTTNHRVVAACAATAFMVLAATAAPAAQGDCGQPITDGEDPTTTDCLLVLKAAVGSEECPLCVCDVDSNTRIVASDALRCLKNAVGGDVEINCPECPQTTTTTVTTTTRPSTTTTSSSSTSSSSTTLPEACLDDGDCEHLGAQPGDFLCNPNTDLCERPCETDDDCSGFLECNTQTNLCEPPA